MLDYINEVEEQILKKFFSLNQETGFSRRCAKRLRAAKISIDTE